MLKEKTNTEKYVYNKSHSNTLILMGTVVSYGKKLTFSAGELCVNNENLWRTSMKSLSGTHTGRVRGLTQFAWMMVWAQALGACERRVTKCEIAKRVKGFAFARRVLANNLKWCLF